MDAQTRTLHETLLRLLKGALRAYEAWYRAVTGADAPHKEGNGQ